MAPLIVLLSVVIMVNGLLMLTKGRIRWERELEIEKNLPEELASRAKEISIRKEILVTSWLGGGLVFLGVAGIVSCALI